MAHLIAIAHTHGGGGIGQLIGQYLWLWLYRLIGWWAVLVILVAVLMIAVIEGAYQGVTQRRRVRQRTEAIMRRRAGRERED